MWVIRAVYFNMHGNILFVREQAVGPEDKLVNALRRHSVWSAKRVEKNNPQNEFTIKSFNLEVTWREPVCPLT